MKKLLALTLTLCLLLGGCSGGSGSSAPEASGADSTGGGEPQYKDTIVLATASDQNYMDGQMNNTNDKVLRTVYSSLVQRRPSDGEIIPDLAESWEVSEDQLTWTFHLRKDVKFQNGKALTAKDVKASYDRLLNKEKPVRYTSTMSFLKECVAVDDYTVQLKTADPAPAMLANLTHRSNLILDADYIEQYGTDLGLTAESCNGTGPYKLVKWDMGEQMEFEAFGDYYAGEVPTKHFKIVIMPEAASRAVALETGEVDIADGVASDDMPRLQETPGIAVNFYPYQGQHGFQFNCANEYLGDPKVRQAVSYAIDRESMIEALYSQKGETCCTAPLAPVVWGYHEFGVVKQDLEKSKQLLTEAGYPDGFSIIILVVETYDKALASAEMIVSDLAKVNIKAEIDVVDQAGFKAMQGNRSFPGDNFKWGMFIMGFGPGTLDADEGLRRIWTTSPNGNNDNNYGWYSNATVDELLQKAAIEMDETVRRDLYKQAMQILYLDDPAAVWTNDRRLVYCMSDKVEGFQVDTRNAINYTTIRCLA